MTNISLRRALLRRSMLALTGTALLAGIAAAPARADDDDWRRHERREHEERERAHQEHQWAVWCHHHPGAYAYPGYVCPMPAPPAVVYAPAPPPPAVVYAPAPPPPPAVIYQPPPTVEFVVPIHIR